jgi:hypothetical protein
MTGLCWPWFGITIRSSTISYGTRAPCSRMALCSIATSPPQPPRALIQQVSNPAQHLPQGHRCSETLQLQGYNYSFLLRSIRRTMVNDFGGYMYWDWQAPCLHQSSNLIRPTIHTKHHGNGKGVIGLCSFLPDLSPHPVNPPKYALRTAAQTQNTYVGLPLKNLRPFGLG